MEFGNVQSAEFMELNCAALMLSKHLKHHIRRTACGLKASDEGYYPPLLFDVDKIVSVFRYRVVLGEGHLCSHFS